MERAVKERDQRAAQSFKWAEWRLVTEEYSAVTHAIQLQANLTSVFAAGDPRANVNLHMVALHTLFHLEHNKKARMLHQRNPSWSDQELFDASRQYVIALIQKEFYYHYLPLLLGKRLPEYNGYNASLDPAIDVTFLSTAFRYGHSATGFTVYLATEDRHPVTTGNLNIRDTIFNPVEIQTHGLDRLLRGVLLQPEADPDVSAVEEIRNHEILQDLIAFDMQRARDRGVASLNEVRTSIGMNPYASFEELTPETDVQRLLRSAYSSIEEVEAYVGGLAERPVVSGVIPPTFERLFTLQFERLRAADRFHFEKSGVLDAETLQEVRGRTLSAMIKDHTSIQSFADDAFLMQDILTPESCNSARSELGTGSRFSVSPLPGLTFSWNIDWQSESLYVQLHDTSKSHTWIGIGFNTSRMVDADVVVAESSAMGITVRDMHIGHDALVPQPDAAYGGSDNIIQSNGSHGNGVFTASFIRPFRTSDSLDADLFLSETSPASVVDFIFAYGENELSYHGHFGRVAISIDLKGTSENSSQTITQNSSYTTYFALHGAAMLLMWGGLVPWTFFVLHFFRSLRHAVEVHLLLVQAGALSVYFFGVGALFVVSGPPLRTAHGKLGVGILVLMTVQLVYGWFCRLALRSSKNSVLILNRKRLHRYNGWLLTILAAVNCWLGVDLYFGGYSKAGSMALSYFGFVVGEIISLKLGAMLSEKEVDVEAEKALPTWSLLRSLQSLSEGRLLLLVTNKLVDIRDIVPLHPGGSQILKQFVGCDATEAFLGKNTTETTHRHSSAAEELLRLHTVAKLEQIGKKRLFHRMFIHSITSLNESKNTVLEIVLVKNAAVKTLMEEAQPGQYVRFLVVINKRCYVRSYTPIVEGPDHAQVIKFAVKVYGSGQLTPRLLDLQIGDSLNISGPHGRGFISDTSGATSYSSAWHTILLFVGGSGLTLALSILHKVIGTGTHAPEIWLMVANSRLEDFFYLEELGKLAELASGNMHVSLNVSKAQTHILRKFKSPFRVKRQRPSLEALCEIEPPIPCGPKTNNSLVVCSGPSGFCECIQSALVQSFGYEENDIHVMV